MIKDKLYYQYAEGVLQNKIITCEFVKLACQRFIDDLQRDDLDFR